MAKVHCTKCGIKGNSKNPWTRGIFVDTDDPRAHLDSILSCFMTIETVEKHFPAGHPQDGNPYIETTVSFKLANNDAIQAMTYLKGLMTRESFDPKVIGCIHKWDLMPGETAEC